MISVWHLVWLLPLAICLGALLHAVVMLGGETNEHDEQGAVVSAK